MVLKSILIEDEVSSLNTLQNLIENYCDGVEVVATARNIEDAVIVINKHNPDLLFLDIEMPKHNGFKIFDFFPNPSFNVIFTTAYANFALKAIKMSAVDYLLKPINLMELKEAIAKVQLINKHKHNQERFLSLQQNLKNNYQKLVLPTNSGYSFVELPDLVRCEAQRNYTMFYLTSGEKILVCKTLKLYSDMLEDFNFFRISRSHLVNLNHIKKFGRQKSPTITLSDGLVLSVSLYKKNEFIQKIECLV